LARECLSRGHWWRELKEVNKPPILPNINKNGAKNRWFPSLIDLKIAKNAVFY
jgi:hypothetical protein